VRCRKWAAMNLVRAAAERSLRTCCGRGA
jgi:hypothetical protein